MTPNKLDRLSNLSLKTPRLSIRTARKGDLEQIYLIHSIDEVNNFLPYNTWQTMSDAQAWYQTLTERRQQGDAEQFVLLGSKQLIGTVIVFNLNSQIQRAEIGYVLGRTHWGKGYMSEALATFIPSIIERLGLLQLEAKVERGNVSSSKLLKSLGFKHSGDTIKTDGTLLDLFVTPVVTPKIPQS